MIDDGETGLLVPAGDAEALAAAMARLIDDAALRERLGAAATRAGGRFTPEVGRASDRAPLPRDDRRLRGRRRRERAGARWWGDLTGVVALAPRRWPWALPSGGLARGVAPARWSWSSPATRSPRRCSRPGDRPRPSARLRVALSVGAAALGGLVAARRSARSPRLGRACWRASRWSPRVARRRRGATPAGSRRSSRRPGCCPGCRRSAALAAVAIARRGRSRSRPRACTASEPSPLHLALARSRRARAAPPAVSVGVSNHEGSRHLPADVARRAGRTIRRWQLPPRRGPAAGRRPLDARRSPAPAR